MSTGWIGEGPDAGPSLPVTEQLLRNRERGPGDVSAIAQARGRAAEARELREEIATAIDPDERAAGMVNRGMAPGMISQLGQRLGDVEAELAGEREKIAKGERVTERVRGMLARGQVGGLEAARMMDDSDLGDPQRVAQLERRADRLRGQLGEAQAMVAPEQERELDGVEAASRAAHRTFVEITRQRMAEAREDRPVVRPFGSVSRGAAARAEEQPVECPDCQDCGFTPEQSRSVHAGWDMRMAARDLNAAAGDTSYPLAYR